MFNRRKFLESASCGFGHLALLGLAGGQARAAALDPLAPKAGPFPAKAKRIIFLFMQGGPSHVDSFDYKPKLDQLDGQMLDFRDARVLAKTGSVVKHRVMKSLWKFKQYGQSGKWASTLFPQISSHADDLCFLHGMRTEGVAHGPATLFLHTGSINLIRPSMGSWVSYGLGTENRNLPGFVTLSPSMGNGGPRNYSNAFLPAVYQGTAVGRAGIAAKESTIRNLSNPKSSIPDQKRYLEFLAMLNAGQAAKNPGDKEYEAVLNSYELGWRMQNFAPETLDLSRENKTTLEEYGVGQSATDNYGRLCLTARRMAEAGVRYIQVNYGDNTNNPAWDQHSNLPKHADHAKAVDQPVAALLGDLKRRGLLEDTLVWFGGEFGRTPYSEKNGTGRDHNPGGFTVWLAGGGVKPAFSYGATDEFGFSAVDGCVHMHDLHATILHLMGLNHEKLTFKLDGRDFRLTDVHGQVVKEIMA
ncbi:MAG: DUF1501 domain-containing protein [Gemmataceae bacterium]|nr:DUF1501 domain-containing protein [Gemmataceae bacterium]